jgi:hypothetical protein
MENKEFIWDEKLVRECLEDWSNRNRAEFQNEISFIESFKTRKSRKPVITVEGKELFEGDKYWCVNTNSNPLNSFINTITGEIKLNPSVVRFLTEESARAWIADNEKKYSIEDIKKAWNYWENDLPIDGKNFVDILKNVNQ